MKYFAFCDEIKLKKVVFNIGDSITFYLPMAKSWSNKKKEKMDGLPHENKPDIDNLLKALLDSLFEEDCKIHHIGTIKKVWAYEGAIEIYK